LGVILSGAIIAAIVYYWNDVEALEKFGYPGVFVLGVLGGATILAPVPVTPIVFIMGGVARPDFAPYLGPLFIGLAAGAGETVGAALVYATGFAGGIFLPSPTSRHYDVYSHITKWMEKREGIILFVLSVVINPFFYPAAIFAGAIHFGFKKYIIICFIGKVIKDMAVAFAGYYGLKWLFQLLGLTPPG